MRGERGQGTVEWVGVVCVVCLLLVGVLATGVGLQSVDLARSVATRILCAVELADGCGDEPLLIATYGDEIGRLVRRHMPTIGFEDGSRAVPVDYRRCRETECGDAPDDGLVHRTDERLPVTAFVHVVDCRAAARAESEAVGDDCSDERAGRIYLQYWLFYANSATEPFSSSFSSFWLEKSLLIGSFPRPATLAGRIFRFPANRGVFSSFTALECDVGAVSRLTRVVGTPFHPGGAGEICGHRGCGSIQGLH